jgi:transketolase
LDATRSDISVGAYVVWEPGERPPEGILVATGSEVSLAVEAAKLLEARGRPVRVVSMPCWEAFEAQPSHYRERVLPPAIRRRLSIEAGTTLGWDRYASFHHGIDRFGESAPAERLAEAFGFTAEAVASHYCELP